MDWTGSTTQLRTGADVPGLVKTIHDLQDRHGALEQAVAPWAGVEAAFE
jgi:hypothetical protein